MRRSAAALTTRALSNGVRWYCPDFGGGAPIYTPEELGANVDEDGNVVDGTMVQSEPMPAPEPPSAAMSLETAEAETNRDGERYGDLDTDKLVIMANTLAKMAKRSDDQQRKLDACRVILAARNG